MPQSLSRMVIH